MERDCGVGLSFYQRRIGHPTLDLCVSVARIDNTEKHSITLRFCMFDHIVLRRAETGEAISAGQIAEALLYYQHVHLIIDRGTLGSLAQKIGTEEILRLLQRPEISAVYTEEVLATHTESVGSFKIHRYDALTVTGNESAGTFKNIQERVQYALETANIDKEKSRKFSKLFIDKVPVRKFSGDYYLKGGISAAAKRDLLDSHYVLPAVRQLLQALPGGYDPGPSLKFDVIDTDLGFHVFHSIDLEAINLRRRALRPPLEEITAAGILTQLQDARGDIALASFYGGDFITSRTASSVIQMRYEQLLYRAALNSSAQRQFVEVVLPDTPSLAEIIDNGERTLDDFFVLLDKAGRFKHWLKSVNPDEGLIRTYMRDVSAEGWIQKLPAKTARYIMTLALDATTPTVGLISGFVDNFLVEKLLGGWRPNHFISGRLGPFVNQP